MVAYHRSRPEPGEPELSPPTALLDAWLLRQFPGRTLDELDQMDLYRYLRARAAANIERVETLRQRQIDGKDVELDEDDWRMILEHDALMGDEA